MFPRLRFHFLNLCRIFTFRERYVPTPTVLRIRPLDTSLLRNTHLHELAIENVRLGSRDSPHSEIGEQNSLPRKAA